MNRLKCSSYYHWVTGIVLCGVISSKAMGPAEFAQSMQRENSQVSSVKEIYIIPMTEIKVTEEQVGKKLTQMLEKEKSKKPHERAVAAGKKAEEIAKTQRSWQVILAQPVLPLQKRLWQVLPFTDQMQPRWQILYKRLTGRWMGKREIKDEKELEKEAYILLSQLTYKALSKTNTQFDKYVSEYIGPSEKPQLRPDLPRIISKGRAYFFIPIVADIPLAKLNSNARRVGLGDWSRYGLASMSASGALNMEGILPGMTVLIDEEDKHFIQSNWGNVVSYVNTKLAELVTQWSARKERLQLLLEPSKNRWDDFTRHTTISSDINSPNSVLYLNAELPFSVNDKKYASPAEYYVLKIQDCSKSEDASGRINCQIRAMFEANYYKFKHGTASREALKKTGNAILLYNTEDPLFGVGVDKKGQNQVGRIQMFFRDNLSGISPNATNDAADIERLWKLYTPNVQEWGKNYSQERFKNELRYLINRMHILERIARLFGWQR